MTKNFPKSRLCLIDAYEAFSNGLQEAITFTKQHNIVLGSVDGKRLVFSHCLKHLNESYKTVSSPFNKVMFVDSKKVSPKLKTFVDHYLPKIMEYTTIPYCGVVSSSSPEIESIAERSLNKNKSSYLVNLAKTNKLRLKCQQ